MSLFSAPTQAFLIFPVVREILSGIGEAANYVDKGDGEVNASDIVYGAGVTAERMIKDAGRRFLRPAMAA